MSFCFSFINRYQVKEVNWQSIINITVLQLDFFKSQVCIKYAYDNCLALFCFTKSLSFNLTPCTVYLQQWIIGRVHTAHGTGTHTQRNYYVGYGQCSFVHGNLKCDFLSTNERTRAIIYKHSILQWTISRFLANENNAVPRKLIIQPQK